MQTASLPPRRAFTLIELLVVISIISLLVTLLLPALRMGRETAKAIRANCNARQLMTAHLLYQQDHGGHVMWGYTGTIVTINSQPVQARLGGHVISGYWAGRYPIRLIPYLSDQWPLLWDHADEIPSLPQPGDTITDVWQAAARLTTNTAFGINSTFVGGDSDTLGFLPPGGSDRTPNYGKHVVFHDREVVAPSRLIVFAESSEYLGGTLNSDRGYHRVSPPQTTVNRWRTEGDKFVIEDTGASSMGLPQGRRLHRTATVFFDGHAATMGAASLDDMRLWANRATRHDYNYLTD